MSEPRQFLFSRRIGDASFSIMATCADLVDAQAVASATGWELLGDQVTTIPCVPIPQFMQFLSSLMEGGEADFRIQWKPHAGEQIEAFIQAGWPEEPHEL